MQGWSEVAPLFHGRGISARSSLISLSPGRLNRGLTLRRRRSSFDARCTGAEGGCGGGVGGNDGGRGEEEGPALFADIVSMSGTKSGNRPV